MTTWARELVTRRELLLMLAWRDITIKYKQSVMGFLWAVLMPFVIVSAGVLVRTGFSYLSGTPLQFTDVAAVSVKAVPWAFVVAAVRFATSSLISNASLVTKIYFPREVFPIAATGAQLLDLAVATVPVGIILAIAGVGVSWTLAWVPVLVVLLLLLTTGLGIALSAASLFFRDVKYLVEVFLTFAIFFTPVFYDTSMFGKWAPVLLLNPFAPLLEGLASVVVHHSAPPLGWVAYSAAWAVGGTVVALVIFKRLEPRFAESI